MDSTYASYVSLALPLVTTLVMLGVTVGVFRSRLRTLEQSLDGMGERFNADLKEFKEVHLKAAADRIKENEGDTKRLTETVIRIEERIVGWQGTLDIKLDALSKQIEKKKG